MSRRRQIHEPDVTWKKEPGLVVRLLSGAVGVLIALLPAFGLASLVAALGERFFLPVLGLGLALAFVGSFAAGDRVLRWLLKIFPWLAG